MKKIQYGTWDNEGFWALFDNIEDAVGAEEGPIDVYRLEAKLIGRYKKSFKCARVKKR